jgi:hypothetical protein
VIHTHSQEQQELSTSQGRPLQCDLVGSPSFRLVMYRGMSQIPFQAKRRPRIINCVPKVDLLRTKFQWHFLRTLKPGLETSFNTSKRVFCMFPFHLRRISAVWPSIPKCHNKVLLLNLTCDFSLVVKEILKHSVLISIPYLISVCGSDYRFGLVALISVSLSFFSSIFRGHFNRFYCAFSIAIRGHITTDTSLLNSKWNSFHLKPHRNVLIMATTQATTFEEV